MPFARARAINSYQRRSSELPLVAKLRDRTKSTREKSSLLADFIFVIACDFTRPTCCARASRRSFLRLEMIAKRTRRWLSEVSRGFLCRPVNRTVSDNSICPECRTDVRDISSGGSLSSVAHEDIKGGWTNERRREDHL